MVLSLYCRNRLGMYQSRNPAGLEVANAQLSWWHRCRWASRPGQVPDKQEKPGTLHYRCQRRRTHVRLGPDIDTAGFRTGDGRVHVRFLFSVYQALVGLVDGAPQPLPSRSC